MPILAVAARDGRPVALVVPCGGDADVAVHAQGCSRAGMRLPADQVLVSGDGEGRTVDRSRFEEEGHEACD